MITIKNFTYEPGEHESEKASNSYLMSFVALIAGLPLPVINLIATMFFYIGNRNGTYFVRWHCMQALLSQVTLLLMNSVGFWWVILIIFGSKSISNGFIAYLITIVIFNTIEFIMTIYTAIKTRNGIHVEWWFLGNLTNKICKT